MRSPNESSFARYDAVAMALHWLIALAIIGLLAGGLWMSDALRSDHAPTQQLAFEVIQIHKAMGLTILALSVLRLVWRLLNPPPPLPESMPFWQRAASHFSHFCFYGFMLAMPLMGWIMVSTSPEFKSLPTTWFDLFTVPHLPISEPVAAAFGAATEARLPELAHNGHQLLAWLAIALLVVHVGAALKHHYADKDEVFARMAPWASPKEPVFAPPAPRASGVATALAILLLLGAGGAAAALFLTPERAAAPVIEASLAAPAADAARDEPVAAAETALASEAAAPLWTVAPEASEISFSGTQLGAPFSGAFARWRAEIRFDPEALEESAVRVEIETASAATGDIQVDGALPGADFFDSAAHPLAVFEASVFANADAAPEAAAGETAYRAEGTVTIKGVSAPVAFPFTLAIEDDQAVMRGALSLDRIAYELGLQADAAAAIISREIEVSLEVTATRGAP